MKRERFDSMILDGHEGLAFEIPFGPGQRWRTTAVRLRRGRLGHRVRGTVNKVRFESVAVARARRVVGLVTDETPKAARLRSGAAVKVSLASALSRAD